MGISTSFDLSRVTNLENRANSNDVTVANLQDTANNKIDKTVTSFQDLPNLNITGTNNGLKMTTVNANTQWLGGMEDTYTYYYALGKFASNSRVIELRSYMDNLILRSGRKAGATSGGITLITNDSNTAGINSDINLSPNTAQGGTVNVNANLHVTPPNNSNFYMYMDASVNYGINWTDIAGTKAGCKLKFLTDGSAIQARKVDDSAFIPMAASSFVVGSMEDTKEEIEDYQDTALENIKKTKVRKYKLKHHETDRQEIGLIFEEAPADLQQGEGVSIYNMCSMLWKAVQELSDQVDQLKGAAAK